MLGDLFIFRAVLFLMLDKRRVGYLFRLLSGIERIVGSRFRARDESFRLAFCRRPLNVPSARVVRVLCGDFLYPFFGVATRNDENGSCWANCVFGFCQLVGIFRRVLMCLVGAFGVKEVS